MNTLVTMARAEDEEIGRHVARLRAEIGLTLDNVADKMTERGHSWRQSTAWKVEHGERVLRASEVTALAEVLDVSVFNLLNTPSDKARRASTYATDVVRASDELRLSIGKLLDARVAWRLVSSDERDALREFNERTQEGDDAPLAIDAMSVGMVVAESLALWQEKKKGTAIERLMPDAVTGDGIVAL